MPSRPSHDQYMMAIAEAAARRSTCPRAHVGAVLVMDRNVVATGYNGSPRGLVHCDAPGVSCHLVQDGDRERCTRTVHAEVNAILQGSNRGTVANSTLYTTHQPCLECAKIIINAGVRRVVWAKDYPDERARDVFGIFGVTEMFLQAGIKVDQCTSS